jgi:hypothetical protein
MASDSVLYNGRSVLKEHFRVFLYGSDSSKKLVNNYEDYEKSIASGLWFDSLKALEINNKDIKANKKANTKKKPVFTSGTFEVTNDGQEEQ